MEFKNEKLELLKNALGYAVMYAKTESETSEFGFMYVEVCSAIVSETEQKKRIEKLKSLDGCVFKYCAYNPKCVGICGNN